MSVELVFTAPNSPMSENEVRHWAAKQRRLRPWREEIAEAWLAAEPQWPEVQNQRCRVEIVIPFRTKRRRDPHNYVGTVCKALIDELVKQGAWEDDNPLYVTVPEPILDIRDDEQVIVRLIPESVQESLERLSSHTPN